MDNWSWFKTALKYCIEYNGTVYGGAVRDLALRNIHSKEFFKTHSNADYLDDTISKDTLGRLVIPKDIDCLIKEDDSTKLIDYLLSKYFIRVKEVNNIYFTNHNYKHIKLGIIFDKNSPCVKIDLIVQRYGELIMPFINLDFDVNGLILSLNGFTLSDYLRKNPIWDAGTLQDILDNIRMKKAVAMDGCPSHRYSKMHTYGWDIEFTSTIFKCYLGEPYDGECIICKEKIPDDMCCVKYKKCSCDLRVCLKCMLTHHVSLGKCPLCKEICYKEAEALRDLTILKIKHLTIFSA